MRIEKIKSSQLVKAYNIHCQFLGKYTNLPFYPTWCEIEVDGKTAPHQHQAFEIFIILAGQGIMQIENEEQRVAQGDVIYIDRFNQHQLRNTGQEPLSFLSIYSELENFDYSQEAITIYAAPITPNGKMHLGHLSGPYLAADILNRYYQKQGLTSAFITGTDDYQNYVSYLAAQQKQEAKVVADHYRNHFLKSLTGSGIKPTTVFSPQQGETYQKNVNEFVKRLIDQKIVIEKTIELPYCQDCKVFLIDAYLSAYCSQCDQPITGSLCEGCNFHADLLGGVKSPSCRICQQTAIFKATRQYVFPVKAYQAKLQAYYQQVSMNAHLQQLTQAFLSAQAEEILVSYPEQRGVSIKPGQTINVWLEMAAALYQEIKTGPSVLFFGIDNSYYYSFFIPAILLAYDEATVLPKALVTNEFYQLEGQKFSTSRQHAVWVEEALNSFNSSVLRWYLCLTRPESEQTSFSFSAIQKFREEVFEGKLEAWFKLIANNVAEVELEFNLPASIEEKMKFYEQQLHYYFQITHFSPRRIARLLLECLEEYYYLSQYSEQVVQIELLKHFLNLAEPMIPEIVKQVSNQYLLNEEVAV